MIKIFLCSYLLLFCLCQPALSGEHPTVIVIGNKRTKSQHVQNLVQRYYNSASSSASLTRIKSELAETTLYSSVDVTASTAMSPHEITVVLRERFSVTPVFVPYVSPDLQSLLLGFQDANFLGRTHSAGVSIGFRNSVLSLDPLGSFWVDTSNIKGTGWGTETQVEVQARTTPVYKGNSFDLDFAYLERKYSGHLALKFKTQKGILLGYAFQAHHARSTPFEAYQASASTTHSSYWQPKISSVRNGVFLGFSTLRFNEPNFEGFSIRVSQWNEQVIQLQDNHFDTILTFKYFLPFAKNWLNLGIQQTLAGTTASAYYLLSSASGSFKQIRGFPERFFRAKSLAALNIELRAKLFQKKWLAAQIVPFWDQIAMVKRHTTTAVFNDYANSLGIGIFGWSPKFATGSVRMDVAWPLAGKHNEIVPRYAFSLSHFF